MKRVDRNDDEYRITQFVSVSNRELIRAQSMADGSAAFVCLGSPLLGLDITMAEAIAIADEFAMAMAVVHSDMRATLARLRSTPRHAEAGLYEVAP